jgi:hypothetical protein
VCAQGCEEAADCCPLGSIGCPSDEYPNNYACTDGICEFGGCTDNAECESILEQNECHPVNGVGTCFEPCEENGDCLVGECVGMADDGSMFCTTETPPCEEDDDCAGLGLCNVDDGTCYCDSSKNCTDMTLDTCTTDP